MAKSGNTKLGLGIEADDKLQFKFNIAVRRRLSLIFNKRENGGNDISIRALSKGSGVAHSAILKLLNMNTTNVSLFTIYRICKTIKVPLSVFLEGIEEEIEGGKTDDK